MDNGITLILIIVAAVAAAGAVWPILRRTLPPDAIADLAQRYPGQTICVVTHGGNVRSAMVALPDAPEDVDVRAGYIFNTSVTVLHVTAGGARLIAPPDTSHLDGLASEINEEADDEPR